MKLKRVSVGDKHLFDEFLSFAGHELSAYAFENIYIWKAVFDIYWTVIEDSLCVFFADKAGMFMYLPPLAAKLRQEAVAGAFGIMDSFNGNNGISRIENIEGRDIGFYNAQGYCIRKNESEYLCLQKDLARLEGGRFKSKRAPLNYFIKNYTNEYLPFSPQDKSSCLRFYGKWARGRGSKNTDRIYCGMIEDSRSCLKVLLDDYAGLGFSGRVVKINGRIKGFTLGFGINDETFCILYEITDLKIKGLSQFIFQRFSAEMSGCRYINIMGDSGMDNLRRTKLSYRPARTIQAYIAGHAEHMIKHE